MGSFNTTCAISRLPIGMGDEVKLFIIVDTGTGKNRAGHVYHNDYWNLYGLPIDVVYDDYGRYELIETEQNLKVWNATLRNLKYEIEEYDAGSRSPEVSRGTLTFESFQHAIQEGVAQSSYFPYSKFDLFAVHADVFNHLSEEFVSYGDVRNCTEKVQLIKTEPFYNMYLNVDKTVKYIESLDLDNKEELTEEDKVLDAFLYEMQRIDNHSINCPKMYKTHGIHLNSSGSVRVTYTPYEYALFVKELVEMFILECNMSKLNIAIRPIMTSGQQYHLLDHVKFHQMIS